MHRASGQQRELTELAQSHGGGLWEKSLALQHYYWPYMEGGVCIYCMCAYFSLCMFSKGAKVSREILMIILPWVCARGLSDHMYGLLSMLALCKLLNLLYSGYTYIISSSPSTSLLPCCSTEALNTHVFVSTYLNSGKKNLAVTQIIGPNCL